eukprot:4410296-Prymnesium_polylepis.1
MAYTLRSGGRMQCRCHKSSAVFWRFFVGVETRLRGTARADAREADGALQVPKVDPRTAHVPGTCGRIPDTGP